MAVVNEAVAEVAEEVAEVAIDVAEVSRGLTPSHFGFLALGLAVGGGAGFLVARKHLETKYDKMAEEEIAEMRDHFRARLVAKEEKPDLSDLAEKVEDLGYSAPNAPTPEPPKLTDIVEPTDEELDSMVEEDPEGFDSEESKNIFEDTSKDASQEWDYEEEVRLRRPEFPYVIHYDERGEKPYTETSLVYYEGDDVLCDAHDVVVDDKEKVVGETNLTKFGHGSNDRNVVYIRNDTLALEIEVIRNEASYAEVVHGFKHSDYDTPHRRPQFDDD